MGGSKKNRELFSLEKGEIQSNENEEIEVTIERKGGITTNK
jgi:hypothetical protein